MGQLLDPEPPQINLIVDSTTVDPDNTVQIKANVTDNGDLAGVALTVNEVPVPLDDNGQATLTAEQPGRYTLVVTARDTAGNSWRLVAQSVSQASYTVLASGSEPVNNQTVATFDPTLLMNGFYRLILEAEDANGRTANLAESSLACDNLPGEVESLEMGPDNRLVFGRHEPASPRFHLYDADNCQMVTEGQINTPYDDIEAIAWPSANCTAPQRAFFLALKDEDVFIGADRTFRFTKEGQTHQGLLSAR